MFVWWFGLGVDSLYRIKALHLCKVPSKHENPTSTEQNVILWWDRFDFNASQNTLATPSNSLATSYISPTFLLHFSYSGLDLQQQTQIWISAVLMVLMIDLKDTVTVKGLKVMSEAPPPHKPLALIKLRNSEALESFITIKRHIQTHWN